MKRGNLGFTLVEIVVVIAVVALLAAIVVPMVAKQVDDAKIGRAKNELTVLSQAILSFYKDVGLWPAAIDNAGARSDNGLLRLVSGTAVVDLANGIGTDYGYTSNNNDSWYDGGQTAAAGKVDVFDNHLNVNKPEGVAGAAYPATGEQKWRGPYSPPIGKDPWGHYYVCNINYGYSGSSVQCVVMSSGPDGEFDTAVNPAATVVGPTVDDIWVVVHTR